MKLDEILTNMNLSSDEKEILEYLFLTRRKMRELVTEEIVQSHQKIILDTTVHKGITPVDIIDFLRFNENYNTECSFHLGTLPEDLFQKAKIIWNKSKNNKNPKQSIRWAEEGL